MSEVVAGIKENELSALSLEISDYARKISGILGKIDNAMGGLQDCYQGPSANVIMQRYSEIKVLYPIVKDNISSYSNDLAVLIRKMRSGDMRFTGLFNQYSADLHGRNKQDFNLNRRKN